MKTLVFLLLGLLLLSANCKPQNQNPVPFVPVDVTIDIQLPSYSELQGVGGWTYINGGSRGIIIYRRGIEDFVAFDRHSPADPDGTCSLPLFPDAQNRKKFGRTELDIFIPSVNIGIEYDGAYWHKNNTIKDLKKIEK